MSFKLFPALLDCPKDVKLVDQEQDENIELVLRQHFVTNVSWIFSAIIGFLFPMSLPKLSQSFDLSSIWQIPTPFFLAAVALWYMFIFAYVLEKFLRWYFNIYIVTNKHLIDINFLNLLNRDVTEVLLDDVQSAASNLRGILGSLFNFGDVVIETAAKGQTIKFMAIPQPDFVKERIQKLQETQEGGRNVS